MQLTTPLRHSQNKNVKGGQFVNPVAEVDGLKPISAADFSLLDRQEQTITAQDMIAKLNQLLKGREPIPMKKEQVKTMRRLAAKLGTNPTYWLALGYTSFDHKIPQLIGSDGIYMAPERMGELHHLSSFTPSLDLMTRIQLDA